MAPKKGKGKKTFKGSSDSKVAFGPNHKEPTHPTAIETEESPKYTTVPAGPAAPEKAAPKMKHVDGVLVFGEQVLTDAAVQVIEAVQKDVPHLKKFPNGLNGQAQRMHSRVSSLLRMLGRAEGETGMKITMKAPITDLPDAQSFKIAGQDQEVFEIDAKEVKRLCRTANINYCSDAYHNPGDVLKGTLKDSSVYLKAQLIAVSGEAYVMFNHEAKIQARSQCPIVTVSIPGINFAYSAADKEAFTTEFFTDDDRRKKRLVVARKPALQRMRQIVLLACRAFQRSQVEYPCFCAIGCGAFKGAFEEVPSLWAQAFHEVLSNNDFGFVTAFFSLPNFGENNFSVFHHEFSERENAHTPHLKVPVVLCREIGMVSISDYLAHHGKRSGILNPSDVQAVKQGMMGMYWDGGHIALEEVLAMQTTLLLQHIGVNPDLWADEGRRIGVKL